jgi:3-methyladenine DNA glycosylase/8-oxoguanine DNA glycosylase
MPDDGVLETVIPLPWAIDLRLTLGPSQRGPHDLTTRLWAQQVIRATRTPDGPATVHIQVDARSRTIAARAWGPGKVWVLEQVPAIVGATDDSRSFGEILQKSAPVPGLSLVKDLHRRYSGLRITRTGVVTETLVPTILEQKVTGQEAHLSYRQMVAALGAQAPGPPAVAEGLMLPPSPSVLAAAPYWRFHSFGVERKRAETIRLACSYATRLDRLSGQPSAYAREQMTSIVGVGPWSAAEVALTALGDPDAVSLGDFHIPHQVAWAMTGVRRSSDERMLELLEPFRGHRGRVIRLLDAGGVAPPRRGPRQPFRSMRSI